MQNKSQCSVRNVVQCNNIKFISVLSFVYAESITEIKIIFAREKRKKNILHVCKTKFPTTLSE